MWLVGVTCKKVPFGRFRDSHMLKYLFRERGQWYFKEIDSENMCAKNINNEKITNLDPEGFMRYL
jgi:hypothetical protein